jgi:hypothetical protein
VLTVHVGDADARESDKPSQGERDESGWRLWGVRSFRVDLNAQLRSGEREEAVSLERNTLNNEDVVDGPDVSKSSYGVIAV